MRNKLKVIILMTALLVLISVTGCDLLGSDQAGGSEEEIQQRVAETMIAFHVAETLASGANASHPPQAQEPGEPLPEAGEAAATLALTPTITLTPTMTLTPTLDVPMASVSVNTNCRTGPDKIYDIVGSLLVEEQAEVVGRTSNGTYWVIKNPDGSGECWLWDFYATVVGPTDGLVVYTPPPTPTPAFDWAGIWAVADGLIGDILVARTMHVTVTGKLFTGSVTTGDAIIFNGTISDDYLSVSGNWTSGLEKGPFKIYALGVNQFQGYYEHVIGDFEFCGARGGATFPSPCYKK